MIDLRSDTVTLPSEQMKRAMYEAELGDDGYGEDPSVNRLEAKAAELMGKEAAVFVSSGTMGNLLGILTGAQPGDEVIADSQSHTFLSEAAGAAMVGGVQIVPLPTRSGIFAVDQLEVAIRSPNVNNPRTSLVLFENSHNRHGGVVWPLSDLREVFDFAHERDLVVHMDGARIFNAALASAANVAEIASTSDTVTFCLSKGLGCPAGSVFCGSDQVVGRARHWRKMLGGAMRQVGVLAAAGLYALDNMVERLGEDHANAQSLAEGLAALRGVEVDMARVQTNLVVFEVKSMPVGKFLEECAKRGVLARSPGGKSVRLVTHFGVSGAEVKEALGAFEEVLDG